MAHPDEFHLVFAGGIHDRLSAAMVAALAAPLSARGMKIGVLMGTAYLFTREAVQTGAILPEFQRQALPARRRSCWSRASGTPPAVSTRRSRRSSTSSHRVDPGGQEHRRDPPSNWRC